MKNLHLTASYLRIILSAALVVVAAVTVVIFIFGHGQLVNTAKETSELATKAESSNSEQRNLEMTKRELLDLEESIERASSIVAVSESYKYQDQIILEIGELARKNGIVVESVTFDSSDAGSAATPTATTTVTPAEGATPGAETAAEGAPAAVGAAPAAPALKTRSATIALSSPINYDQLISFIYLIEQNITKMRVLSLNLSTDSSSGDRNAIQSDSLEIEVYLR